MEAELRHLVRDRAGGRARLVRVRVRAWGRIRVKVRIRVRVRVRVEAKLRHLGVAVVLEDGDVVLRVLACVRVGVGVRLRGQG